MGNERIKEGKTKGGREGKSRARWRGEGKETRAKTKGKKEG
jgi:hypothetical protein